MNTKTTTTAAKAGFEWNETTVSKATELYQALIESDGLEIANSSDSLGKIAKAIGAKSAQAVRSKLSNEKVYQKAEKARSVRGVVRTQKVHYIRALQSTAKDLGVDLTGRKFDSLEQGVATDLQLVIDLLSKATGKTIIVNPEATEEAPAPRQETAKA